MWQFCFIKQHISKCFGLRLYIRTRIHREKVDLVLSVEVLLTKFVIGRQPARSQVAIAVAGEDSSG